MTMTMMECGPQAMILLSDHGTMIARTPLPPSHTALAENVMWRSFVDDFTQYEVRTSDRVCASYDSKSNQSNHVSWNLWKHVFICCRASTNDPLFLGERSVVDENGG